MSYALTTKDIQQLVNKTRLKLRDVYHIEPEDIVNDVILEAMEKGESLLPEFLLKKIYAKTSGAKQAAFSSSGRNSRTYSRYETTRVCTVCKEEKSINDYYMVRRKRKTNSVSDGQIMEEILNRCKICQSKYSADREKKLRANDIPISDKQRESKRRYYQKPDVKKKRKEYMKNYSLNPEKKEKNKLAQRRYYNRKKEFFKALKS